MTLLGFEKQLMPKLIPGGRIVKIEFCNKFNIILLYDKITLYLVFIRSIKVWSNIRL